MAWTWPVQSLWLTFGDYIDILFLMTLYHLHYFLCILTLSASSTSNISMPSLASLILRHFSLSSCRLLHIFLMFSRSNLQGKNCNCSYFCANHGIFTGDTVDQLPLGGGVGHLVQSIFPLCSFQGGSDFTPLLLNLYFLLNLLYVQYSPEVSPKTAVYYKVKCSSETNTLWWQLIGFEPYPILLPCVTWGQWFIFLVLKSKVMILIVPTLRVIVGLWGVGNLCKSLRI